MSEEEIIGNTIEAPTLENKERWEGRIFFAPQVSSKEPQRLESLLFSPKPKEERHIRAQLASETSIKMEVDEATGEGKISLENQSHSESSYRLEIW